MMIYLSRHGAASHPGPDKPSSLTPKGKEEVTRMAEYLFRKKKMKVNGIWHSPKTRAIETAQIYWRILGDNGIALEEKINLSPDGDAGQLYGDILKHKEGNLLLVSHLPLLPNLAGLLLGESTGTSSLAFTTAGIAAFESGKSFQLLWAEDPYSIH